MTSLDSVLQKAVKVEEPLKEEEVSVKKRIAHEAACNYPPQVVAPAKPLVNPMHVSCMASCVLKVFGDPPKFLTNLKLNTFWASRTPTVFGAVQDEV
jgi:hypothetical protein